MNVDVCKKADFLYEESDFKKLLCGLRRLLDDLKFIYKLGGEDGCNKDFI
jgi:hypothetical protein